MGPSSIRSRPDRLLLLLLGVHALVFWAVVGSGSPMGTASLECAAGAMADAALGPDRAWSLLDTFDGVLGGMFVAALAGLPLFAIVGVTPLAVAFVTWAFAVAVLLVVYRLLDRHESRSAALLAVAGLALAPPALSSVSLVFGNWHWTELLFDYGVALLALDLLRDPARSRWRWFGLGIATGLGVVNCFGSAPFLVVSWGVLLVGARRRLGFGLPAAVAGLGAGIVPLLYKALVHVPFERLGASAPVGFPRLRPSLDLARLGDLVGPELAWALHVQDVLPVGPAAGHALGGVWLGIAWVGVLVALVTARGRGAGAGTVVLLFIGAFAAAYVTVALPIEIRPLEFSNLRETTHRHLPPLIAALIVGSAIGWSRLLRGRGAVLGVALLPAALGLSTLVAARTADGPGLSAYRASCFDALGFFASAWYVQEPAALQQRCAGWGEHAPACRAGAAWGVGYYRPPGALSADSCGSIDPALRTACLRGLGWSVGEQRWGTTAWPSAACDDLGSDPDRAACWAGVGFLAGDHLHGMPDRMAAVIRRAPPHRRADVARGAGYGLGRVYATAEWSEALCAALPAGLAEPCATGVAEALADR